MDRAALSVAALGVAALSCSSHARDLPPLGEALIVVDTDLPLSLAQRLQVDVYEGGSWIESRDIVLASRASFPVSFSVFSPDPAGDRVAIVRLRMHPEGRTRDYRGERFAPRNPNPFATGAVAELPGDGLPRLYAGGADVTPKEEPSPLVTIDRLLRVHVVAGKRGRVSVTLRTECLGTMADLAGERTCVDTEGALVPSQEEPLAPDMTIPAESVVDSFSTKRGCEAAPRPSSGLFDDDVCVDGALTFLGVPYGQGLIADRGVEIPALLSPFYLDRYEVTVGRFRAAIAAGFKRPADDPVSNEGDIHFDLENPASNSLCTWSSAPRGRESFPLNCVSPAVARAFCRFFGGDLPTEAQWTYATVIAGRPERTPYPWGRETPDCERAIFGRTPDGECRLWPLGPAAVDAAKGDASLGLGIVGLHGSLEEWTRDAFHRLYEGCLYGASLHDPVCEDAKAPSRTVGGVSFAQSSLSHDQRQFAGKSTVASYVGFRCARPGS
ncbi:MAG: formylglycine-generating enzyme family protein [Polyangiales bacterium]